MKRLNTLFAAGLLMVAASCDALTGEPDLPIPLDETMSTTGGFVRVISVESAAFDVFDLAAAKYEFVGEVSDVNNGGDSESVTFYATYVTIGPDGRPAALAEVPIPDATVSVSSMSPNPTTGLPSATFTVTLNQILAAYSGQITSASLKVGDRFDIRWQLNMKNGDFYTNNSVSQSITGGFYRSPFLARANVVVGLPADKYVGSYTFTQDAPAPGGTTTGDFNSGWLWNGAQSFSATLSVSASNALIGRDFSATPFAEYGVSSRDYTILMAMDTQLNSLYATLAGNVTVGLTCGGGGIYYGAVSGGGSFNVANDSQFSLAVMENAVGDCGRQATPITFTLSKN